MAVTLHQEKQRFNDKVVMGLLGVGVIAALFGTVNALFIAGEPLLNVVTYFVIALMLAGCIYWLASLQLKVTVSKKCIKYKLSTPLNEVSEKIKWKEVEDYTIVRTPKIAQWHGANLAYGGENLYSLSGRSGLSLTTKSGRHYFIGCDNVERLRDALERLAS